MTTQPLRRLLLVTLLGAAVTAPAMLHAQAFPIKPIRIIVPYSPGGGIDFFARNVGLKMSEDLGQPVVVENKPGGSSVIAAEYVANQPADGYTLLIGDITTYSVNPSMFKKLSYEPAKNFAPISLTAQPLSMMVVVNPAVVSVKTIGELLEMAKRQPGKLNFGSAGQGTPHHLGMELFQQRAGVQMNHVPYKGGAPALQDLLSGHLGVMLLDLPTAIPHLKSIERLRILASATATPVRSLPDVPTTAAAGMPGFEIYAWQGMAAPADTPPSVIARLNAAYRKAIADPTLRAKLVDMGIEPLQSSPKEMADYMQAERMKWAKVIVDAKIVAQ